MRNRLPKLRASLVWDVVGLAGLGLTLAGLSRVSLTIALLFAGVVLMVAAVAFAPGRTRGK